jgi:hypothetical protein
MRKFQTFLKVTKKEGGRLALANGGKMGEIAGFILFYFNFTFLKIFKIIFMLLDLKNAN